MGSRFNRLNPRSKPFKSLQSLPAMIYPISLSSDRFSDREKRFRFLFRLGKTKIQSMVSGLKRIKSYESASRAAQVRLRNSLCHNINSHAALIHAYQHDIMPSWHHFLLPTSLNKPISPVSIDCGQNRSSIITFMDPLSAVNRMLLIPGASSRFI